MRHRFRRWAAAACALLTLATAGCVPTRSLTRDQVLSMAKSSLLEKYGVAFDVYWTDWGGEWASGFPPIAGKGTEFAFYPSGGAPERYFMVSVDTTTDPISFHDCYVADLMAPLYEELARPVINRTYPEALLSVLNTTCGTYPDDEWRETMPLEQYRAWADTHVGYQFCVLMPHARDTDYVEKSVLPSLLPDLQPLAGKGGIEVVTFDPDEFQTKVAPTFDPRRVGDCLHYQDEYWNHFDGIAWGN